MHTHKPREREKERETGRQTDKEMENTTLYASTDLYEEYHPLWLVGMVVLSAISTLAAMAAKRLQKRIQARGINTATDPKYT